MCLCLSSTCKRRLSVFFYLLSLSLLSLLLLCIFFPNAVRLCFLLLFTKANASVHAWLSTHTIRTHVEKAINLFLCWRCKHQNNRISVIRHSQDNMLFLHNAPYNIHVAYCFIVEMVLSLNYTCQQRRARRRSQTAMDRAIHMFILPRSSPRKMRQKLHWEAAYVYTVICIVYLLDGSDRYRKDKLHWKKRNTYKKGDGGFDKGPCSLWPCLT